VLFWLDIAADLTASLSLLVINRMNVFKLPRLVPERRVLNFSYCWLQTKQRNIQDSDVKFISGVGKDQEFWQVVAPSRKASWE